MHADSTCSSIFIVSTKNSRIILRIELSAEKQSLVLVKVKLAGRAVFRVRQVCLLSSEKENNRLTIVLLSLKTMNDTRRFLTCSNKHQD
jgi:hypothetical protein